MGYEESIIRAAELAEEILDEVSSAEQNWRRVVELARELAALAAGLAGTR